MTTPISAATNPAAGVATNAQSRLATNFDTFLTLLTAQLKNQDPLSPMESNEFTQQLVQFSSVEQQINANKNLESLISLTKDRSGIDAVSYLGKTVTITDGTGSLQDGSAKWTYNLQGASTATALVVSDARGRTVYATSGSTAAGPHEFVWDGKDPSGNPLPDGAYKLTVRAEVSGEKIGTSVSSQGLVDEVDLSGSEPILLMGALAVPLSLAARVSGN